LFKPPPKKKTTGQLILQNTAFWAHYPKKSFEKIKIEAFSRNRQIQSFSTSRGWVIAGQIRSMAAIHSETSRREHDPREMLLLSAGKLFQDVGYVQASIYRIASGVNAPKGTFYNYFKSKEDLASRLVDRQFEALHESLSRSTGHSALHRLKDHCSFLALEPPMVEVAPLQLLATLAAEAPAIPAALTQRIARGTEIWIARVSDLISRIQIESGAPTAQDPKKLASLLVTCWYGAVVRRKAEPSLKLLDDFLPFFVRTGVLSSPEATNSPSTD
jgi:TetR/AcrR family transcriptional regulator, transcriptional repressor for nem operon